GWVLANDLGSDIVITNAHVGREFAQRSGTGFKFRRGTIDFSRPQSARIDFREEIVEGNPREFAITEVIWISENEVLDMALLRVAARRGEDRLSGPIRLAPEAAVPGRKVAVVGYPGDDSKSYDAEKFIRLFGRVFGKKRLAPGRLNEPHAWGLRHDCSTLPGNSGSVVLDIETGGALGLHYSGSMFRANYAVPATEILRVMRERPWQPGIVAPRAPLLDLASAASRAPTRGADAGLVLQAEPQADGALKIVVPLEISVRLGLPVSPTTATTAAATTTSTATTVKSDRASAEAAAETVRKHLAGDSAILSVRADYLFRDGVVTDDLGVIVGIRPDTSVDPAAHGLPPQINGVAIEVETADPGTVAEELLGFQREAFSGRRAGYRRDLSKPRFKLKPVTDDMKITLHVSPEMGWSVLGRFLTQNPFKQLTMGMYHMTAPHVVEAIEEVARRSGTRITLTLDRQRGDADPPDDTGSGTKEHDIPEGTTLAALESIAGSRFKWAPASLTAQGLFPTAYHIKVAVWSDGPADNLIDKAFWLSSGNWQSSNQPAIDKEVGDINWNDVGDYNREWHALVEHAGLAATLRNHLEQDFADNSEAARTESPAPPLPTLLIPEELLERPRRPARFKAFAPKVLSGRIKVQPLLTPDNYPEVILDLISQAQERVLIQNQSFSLWSEIDDTPEHFLEIAKAVRQKQRDGLDVRIIFRNIMGSERETIRRLKKFGIKTGKDHLRYFETCHTKGVVIDNEIAVLGSQNWTAAGTGPNRDASLVIWHREANKFFADLFEYDWEQIATNRGRTESAPARPIRIVRAGAETAVPSGYRRMSVADYLGET
ncbi:trypsin-like peptidase domain-containing protein, partial [Bradyrhizobium sp. NBAIM18]|uniref:phospholipase D-like domain-containing protein n=2 Tax=unclassified Bradyrhizobium TaxID=2631580 RepID=UPI001CD805A8